MVQYALQTVEKAYFLFGENITSTMRESTYELLNRYDRQPSFQGEREESISVLRRVMFSTDGNMLISVESPYIGSIRTIRFLVLFLVSRGNEWKCRKMI